MARGARISIWLLTFLIATSVPLFVRADTIDPARLYTLISYPHLPYGNKYQSAYKTGDPVRVDVQGVYMDLASAWVDLSELGFGSHVDLTGDKNDLFTDPPLTLPAVPDGVKTITYHVTNALGDTGVVTATTTVDNVPPTAVITSFSGPADIPTAGWDHITLSMDIDGTGSLPLDFGPYTYGVDADGKIVSGGYTSGAADILNTHHASFTNVDLPIIYPDPSFAAFGYGVGMADAAGNIVTATSAPIAVVAPSNVLFLPGTEASRLYMKSGKKEKRVWEPSSSANAALLAMDANGNSINQIYTKDIIDDLYDIPGFYAVYSPLQTFLDVLVASSTIKEWRAYPYDWRYSVFDIVANGTPTKMPDGKLQQVYLKDVVKQLAATSYSKRVTIVAHSNGGLLAKALLMGLTTYDQGYIDRIILVGTPQLGTPKTIGEMLHGDEDSTLMQLVLTPSKLRSLAVNMPGAYDLLPSSAYFAHVGTPPVVFAPDTLGAVYRNRFGPSVDSFQELLGFLTDIVGMRALQPADSLNTPIALNPALLARAESDHARLDAWTPPSGIPVIEIAGWGQPTISQIKYDTKNKLFLSQLRHVPFKLTQDGDQTVVTPSAIRGLGQDWYFDSNKFLEDTNKKIDHAKLLSSDAIQSAITNLLINKPIDPTYLKTSIPPGGQNPLITMSFDESLLPVVTDSKGRQDKFVQPPGTSDILITEIDIAGSSMDTVDGRIYFFLPQGIYQVSAKATVPGAVTIELGSVDKSGNVTMSKELSAMVTSTTSQIKFSVSPIGNSPLQITN